MIAQDAQLAGLLHILFGSLVTMEMLSVESPLLQGTGSSLWDKTLPHEENRFLKTGSYRQLV